MAYDRMVPEIWSAALLRALRKALVFAQPGVINRNWEGEIKQRGDTVRINSVGRPTVRKYVKGTPLVREQLTDAQRVLQITEQDYYDFEVEDINQAQAQGDIVTESMNEAAYAMADNVDKFIASLYTQANAANNIGTVAVPVATPTDFYDKVLVPLSVKLDEANVPTEGRYCIAPPWLHGRGLLDPRFIKVNESGTEQGLRNGTVGRAAGFDIMKSNNCINSTGDDYVVQAGTSAAITFAEQINKTEPFRPHDSFSDAVKGLAVYGAKVIRPECLAVATVSQT
ncbi:hypothetical protein JOF56_011619 [Kibdelosporangium banguiense]|uniref:P22 coat protein-protein 5 domain protein n=1 Tax=Kibdelosporangium banguiense TaxID=1365924 RepID=A0ABS4U3J8_9PSEU|nr:hypothetical protein [Kibdelosporangium banguiense]MBP2331234.1 hypothetical protein [Kibdelosporangium banguiense]